MEATMRKFFLITLLLVSATTARAGLDVTAANTDVRAPESTQSSSAQRPDASALEAKRQAMTQQKMMMKKQMMMQKQMAMQREMQRHPIRTRVHFALLNFKRKLHHAFR
jgi:hypothetical protein